MGHAANTAAAPAIQHDAAYRRRRFLNWFPLGLAYAFLYMGRYNLTVAKTSLPTMTNEDFGIVFGVGTFVYAFAFLVNGPLVDRIGGRRGMLIGVLGSFLANLAMGGYLWHLLETGTAAEAPLRTVFSVLYGANMYFQSYGAVSIVKVNSRWFHVSERGGFSGIFGTMIASGIFLAFTVNGWFLDLARAIRPEEPAQFLVFLAPAALLLAIFVVELFLLKDRPSEAGFADFDTGDATSGEDEKPLPTLEIFRRIFTNPVILTIAAIEFCTGVVRNGVMHWFPIYAKSVWVLPKDHILRDGSWEKLWLVGLCFAVAAISAFLATRSAGKRRATLAILASLAFLAPFVQGGWGGLLFVAGVIGGNVAGWVSDLFFQSRRGPAVAGLYGMLAVFVGAMYFVLAPPTNRVEWAAENSGLLPGDEIVAIAGVENIGGWAAIGPAVAAWPANCKNSVWDAKHHICSTKAVADPTVKPSDGTIPATIVRDGVRREVLLPDPAPVQRAGDVRTLPARPHLPLAPLFLGIVVFVISVGVIGSHGLLSGTATMDFGGTKGAATAVGVIDGFVYLGTALQSVSLGYLTSRDWSLWPLFLVPFALGGFLLSLRIWNAKPKASVGKRPGEPMTGVAATKGSKAA